MDTDGNGIDSKSGTGEQRVRVLVVEDEIYLAEAVQAGLRLEAIACDIVTDGDAALERLAVHTYDVVVLDRDIPGTHGDDVCRTIVEHRLGCRVLMLTAAARLDEKVAGFELGADDYLTKPFDLAELVVRLRSLARRPAQAAPPSSNTPDCAWTPSAARSTATAATSRCPASSSPSWRS